jgi:hypothetical protein
VSGTGGFQLDLDIRWPDGPPPPGRWPAVFFAHGSGGDKNSFASLAETYADDGYVALTWTGRLVTSQPTPTILAGDVVALKNWVVNDFQNESGFTVPTDPARFGLNGRRSADTRAGRAASCRTRSRRSCRSTGASTSSRTASR